MKETTYETNILRVKREPHWLGDFRLEYDGKYITLFGKDKNYKGFNFSENSPDWYEEMVLMGAVCEGRNLTPEIVEETDAFIYINIGDKRKSLAWTKIVDGVFEPI